MMRESWIERAYTLAEHIVLPSFTLERGDFSHTPVDQLARPLDPETRATILLLSALLLFVLKRKDEHGTHDPTLAGVYRLVSPEGRTSRGSGAEAHAAVFHRIREYAREWQKSARVASERAEWRHVDAQMGAYLALDEPQQIIVLSTLLHVLERCSGMRADQTEGEDCRFSPIEQAVASV
jgi:hypothetical protein